MSQKPNKKGVAEQASKPEKLTHLNETELNHFKKSTDIESRLVLKIGELELQKRNLISQQNEVEKVLAEKQKTLDQWLSDFIYPKYGKCQINPTTGEITLIEPKPDNKENEIGGQE